MRVLIACESSGIVREAFRRRGFDAWSCDLLPADDGSPNHIQGDARALLHDAWDMLIAHPPCTYLSSSGMHWTTRGLRDPQLTEDALALVREFMNAPIRHIAIENPVGCISTRIRKPDQIIQPWMFGDDASKRTCLWLSNLPKLQIDHRQVVPPKGWMRVAYAADMSRCVRCGEPYCNEHGDHYADCLCIGPHEDGAKFRVIDGIQFGSRDVNQPRPVWGNQTPSGQNKLGPSADRWKLRSKTYAGIAEAMADQWGRFMTASINNQDMRQFVMAY